MKKLSHSFDFCVVGGGMAGMIAAIAAARHGAKVALIQDRPVLGGNASSEIRMHICGAHGENNRETGILEETLLENHYRNSQPNYSIWDSVLYGKAQYQDNLTLFLNCSVSDCQMDGTRVKSVTGWQMTTETWHTIEAKLFADCSGDGVLAPLTGAEYRIGRESRSEFGESIAPVEGDKKTMGMSCLFQAREHTTPQPFIAPDWAYSFTKPEDLRGRGTNLRRTNFWWMEVGGDYDSIHDTEVMREELLKIAFGVWDYIKNYSPDKDEFANWALDWQGFLPGKRESRRYVGDHILTQHDIEAAGKFDDLVAYGGWTMDDHFPAGFYHPEAGTIFHPAPSPFGISYRTLYSRNIENLFCAGRNHSATHAAMSATRVMGTTSLMGQAVGTAAAIANRDGLTPRGVYENSIRELQQTLMDDDCWLPWRARPIPALAATAELTATAGDPEPLRNGVDRPVDGCENAWEAACGESVTYTFAESAKVSEIRIVFDSDLNRSVHNMRHCYQLNDKNWSVPESMVKSFKLEIQGENGGWTTVHEEHNNYQRLVRVSLAVGVKTIRLTPLGTWGADTAKIFAFDAR
ncbi:MAG: FAD-dependent oxidoreductase [Lentisphaeria bacterium]|nr:FAD-dependent oxidoreductase [Lentisphaeria bacterium]